MSAIGRMSYPRRRLWAEASDWLPDDPVAPMIWPMKVDWDGVRVSDAEEQAWWDYVFMNKPENYRRRLRARTEDRDWLLSHLFQPRWRPPLARLRIHRAAVIEEAEENIQWAAYLRRRRREAVLAKKKKEEEEAPIKAREAANAPKIDALRKLFNEYGVSGEEGKRFCYDVGIVQRDDPFDWPSVNRVIEWFAKHKPILKEPIKGWPYDGVHGTTRV